MRFLRATSPRAVIDLKPSAGTPDIGRTIDGGRSGRWQVVRVLREAGLLIGAQVEARRI